MNQASLHQIIALENQDPARANDLNKFFELRLSTNLSHIKDLFFLPILKKPIHYRLRDY
jgi:hypothetical protein